MKYSKALDLTFRQWRWFFIAYLKLLVVQLKLRLLDRAWAVREVKKYRANDSMAVGQSKVSDPQPVTLKTAKELHESVRLAARCQFLPTQCLPKALVLAQMLKSFGSKVEVRLGVNKMARSESGAPQLASHAWVELEGLPVGEASNLSSDYVRLTL